MNFISNLKLVAVILFFLCANPSSAQNVQAYLTTDIAFQENGKWGDFQDTSVLVITDYDENLITIYSKNRQTFKILRYGDSWTDSDGDQWASMTCRDNEGIQCTLKVAELHSIGGQNQLYISYANMQMVYNVRPMR